MTNSSDKQDSKSREEVQPLLPTTGLERVEELLVYGSSFIDIDQVQFRQFIQTHYNISLPEERAREQILEDMNLARGGVLNLAAVILFGTRPERRFPSLIVKAAAFPGSRIDGENYIDSRELSGNLTELYNHCISFVLANIQCLQGEHSRSSLGQHAVPRVVWESLIANALVHRDYGIAAPIRVLVFSDRVEIISPGHLPNQLKVDHIKWGNSHIRNPIIASYAAKLLRSLGLGSGILRALRAYPAIEFSDDRSGNLFKVTVARPAVAPMLAREGTA